MGSAAATPVVFPILVALSVVAWRRDAPWHTCCSNADTTAQGGSATDATSQSANHNIARYGETMTFKKSKFAFLFSFLAGAASLVGSAAPAQAASGCFATTVTAVLDYPTKCNGNGAFQTAGSNFLWICAANEQQMRIVTAAYLSGKPFYYELPGTNTTCLPPSSYTTTPLYLYMN